MFGNIKAEEISFRNADHQGFLIKFEKLGDFKEEVKK